MNKIRIVGTSILLLVLFSTSCFAKAEELKTYEDNKTIAIENVEEYRNNIQKEVTIDNIKYELQDIEETENKEIKTLEKEETTEKIVNTNNKYDVLNLFETKKQVAEDGMSGILELQNNSLDVKINDSYKEQYKVTLTKKHENVPSNELNDVPKTIIENGTTYYLINPIWTVSQVEKVEGKDIPTMYNGEMQYEGIKERTIIKNYIATVTYKGTLEKEEVTSISFNIKYKVIPKEETNYTPIIVATAGTGIVVVSGIILWKRKKKNKILK